MKKINNHPELLPCHKLELVHKQGGCDDERSLESLASGLFPQEKSKVVGVIGTGCSASAIHVVKLASRPGIQLFVVHTGGSLVLESYKNSVGILGSSKLFVDLSLALIKENGWQNVIILYEESHPYYHEMADHFLIHLSQAGVVATIVAPLYTYFYPLDEIRSSRVRIVYVFASLEHSKRILCLAFHMGLVFPAYQWVFVSHTLSDFVPQRRYLKRSLSFGYSGMKYTCVDDNLISALDKTFLVSFQFYTDTPGSAYFNESYHEKSLWHNTTKQSKLAYSLYHDALCAWASVLHKLTVQYPDTGFTYANTSLLKLIADQFFQLSFDGMSGHVSFNSNTRFADRQANLYQVSSGRELTIGSINLTAMIMLPSSSFDHIPDKFRKIAKPHAGIIGFFMLAQMVELLVLVVLHVLTFVHRKTKSVKATTPKLVHLAFVGGYIFIGNLMIWSISWTTSFGSRTDVSLCQIMWAWGLQLSFTLTLGIVTMRTWRLYRIFIHYLNPGRFISDSALTVAALLLVSVDVAIAIVWTTADPMEFGYEEVMVKVGSQYETFLIPQCYFNFVWLVLVFLIKLALLVALIVLIVLMRNISNTTFTTNSQRMFAYSFCVISVLGFGTYYFLLFIQYPDPHAEFITLSSLLNIMLVLFVVLIISPPLIPILLRKQRESVPTQ